MTTFSQPQPLSRISRALSYVFLALFALALLAALPNQASADSAPFWGESTSVGPSSCEDGSWTTTFLSDASTWVVDNISGDFDATTAFNVAKDNFFSTNNPQMNDPQTLEGSSGNLSWIFYKENGQESVPCYGHITVSITDASYAIATSPAIIFVGETVDFEMLCPAVINGPSTVSISLLGAPGVPTIPTSGGAVGTYSSMPFNVPGDLNIFGECNTSGVDSGSIPGGVAVTVRPLPVIDMSAASLNFGDVEVGERETREVTIRNTETAANGGRIVVSANPLISGGSDPGDFRCISANCTAQQAIEPDDSVTYTIEYAPGDEGAGTAILRFSGNAVGSFTRDVDLSGNGVVRPLVPTANFTSDLAPIINPTESVTLQWVSTDASECIIRELRPDMSQNRMFNETPFGSRLVTPPTVESSYIYTLTCSNGSESGTAPNNVVVTFADTCPAGGEVILSSLESETPVAGNSYCDPGNYTNGIYASWLDCPPGVNDGDFIGRPACVSGVEFPSVNSCQIKGRACPGVPPSIDTPRAELTVRIVRAADGSIETSTNLDQTVEVDDTYTFTWQGPHALNCTGTNFLTPGNPNAGGPADPTIEPDVNGSVDYTLTCTGPNGDGATAVVNIAKNMPPAPTIDLTAEVDIDGTGAFTGPYSGLLAQAPAKPRLIPGVSEVQLSWNVTDADSCAVVSGTFDIGVDPGFSGTNEGVTEPAAGSSEEYRISCDNGFGITTESVVEFESYDLPNLRVEVDQSSLDGGGTFAETVPNEYGLVTFDVRVERTNATPINSEVTLDVRIDRGDGVFLTDLISVTIPAGTFNGGSLFIEAGLGFTDVPFAGGQIRADISPVGGLAESDSTDNTDIIPVTMPPDLDMQLNADPSKLIRGGDEVELSWDVGGSFSMNCRLDGPVIQDEEENGFVAFDPSIVGSRGRVTVGPIRTKSNYMLACNEPLTDTDYETGISIETTGQVQEI